MLMTPYGWAPYLLQAGTLTIRCACFLCGFTETEHINRDVHDQAKWKAITAIVQ